MDKKIIIENLNKVREIGPLVHNITNFVAMNNTANALLAIGASPVMAHAMEEMEDFVKIDSALVINIGTLSKHWVDAMEVAMKSAKALNKPIIFDPVGAGATPYRTETVKKLIDAAVPTVIRGNASEIMSLVNSTVKTKGVDSSMDSDSAVDSAKLLAKELGCVVVISGQTDYITDGETMFVVKNGCDMMPKVTAMGCTATAITGAFVSVGANPLEAAFSAMAIMSIAGEMSEEKAAGPGTLQLHFLDALYNITSEDVEKRYKE